MTPSEFSARALRAPVLLGSFTRFAAPLFRENARKIPVWDKFAKGFTLKFNSAIAGGSVHLNVS
jgi:hypothetical protein